MWRTTIAWGKLQRFSIRRLKQQSQGPLLCQYFSKRSKAHRPSCRSSENNAVFEMFSLSKALRPEKRLDENIDEVPSDSYVVEDCLILGWVEVVKTESWCSITRCTILRDCTTSPIVGRWFASGETHAAAMVHTRTKSSFGYFPASLGSATSSNLSLSLRIGRACKEWNHHQDMTKASLKGRQHLARYIFCGLQLKYMRVTRIDLGWYKFHTSVPVGLTLYAFLS